MGFLVPVAFSEISEKDSDDDELFANTTEQVAELHALGYSVRDISNETGLTLPQVRRRLLPIKKRWEEEAIKSLEEHVGREVQATNLLMSEAWKQYKQTGDPSYLAVVLRSSELRAKVLGLPKRMGEQKSEGGSTIQSLLESVQVSEESDFSRYWNEE